MRRLIPENNRSYPLTVKGFGLYNKDGQLIIIDRECNKMAWLLNIFSILVSREGYLINEEDIPDELFIQEKTSKWVVGKNLAIAIGLMMTIVRPYLKININEWLNVAFIIIIYIGVYLYNVYILAENRKRFYKIMPERVLKNKYTISGVLDFSQSFPRSLKQTIIISLFLVALLGFATFICVIDANLMHYGILGVMVHVYIIAGDAFGPPMMKMTPIKDETIYQNGKDKE